MTIEEDRSSDKRIMLMFGVLLLVEVVLGVLADAGTISLVVWLILAVGSVPVAGLVSAALQRR